MKSCKLRPISFRAEWLLTLSLIVGVCQPSELRAQSTAGAQSEAAAPGSEDYAKVRQDIGVLMARPGQSQVYALAKARAFVDASYYEYSRNDRSSFPKDALFEAQRIVSAIKGGQEVGSGTSQLGTKERVRKDLWSRLEAVKSSGKWACVSELVARAEVELVHAASELETTTWAHARPQVAVVEELVTRIDRTAAGPGCAARN